jgi:hypothetical protein
VGFHRAPAPSPSDLQWVVETLRRRVLRRLAKMGLVRNERQAGDGSNEAPDPGALEACGTLALRAGQLEAHEGAAADPDDVPSGRRPSRWSAHEQGFNIHAGVRVAAGNDVGRERICKYITRPAGPSPAATGPPAGPPWTASPSCPTAASPTRSAIPWARARPTAS